MSTFNELFIHKFEELLAKIKNSLPAMASMDASRIQTLSKLDDFVEKLTLQETQDLFNLKISQEIAGIINLQLENFDFSQLKQIHSEDPELFINDKKRIMDMISNFYPGLFIECLNLFEKEYSLDHSTIGMFSDFFHEELSIGFLPDELKQIFTGTNANIYCDIFTSMTKPIKEKIYSINIIGIYNRVKTFINTESNNTKNAISINSIWITEKITEYVNDNLTDRCLFTNLKIGIKNLKELNVTSANDIYNYSHSKKPKIQIDPNEEIDANEEIDPNEEIDSDYDLDDETDINRKILLQNTLELYSDDILMLLIATHSEDINELSLKNINESLSKENIDKKSILSAINMPLLFHTILYMSATLIKDGFANPYNYIEHVIREHVSVEQFLPKINNIYETKKKTDKKIDKKTVSLQKALSFMAAFILKVTDYRVEYEVHIESPFEDYSNDSTFKEIPPKSLFYMKCLNELKELEVPITPQEYSDSKATSPTTSPRWPFTSYTPIPPIIHDSFMLDDDYGCNYEPHKKLRSSTPII